MMTPAELEKYLDERSGAIGSEIPKTGFVPSEELPDVRPDASTDLGSMVEQMTPMGPRARGAFDEPDEFEEKSRPLSPTPSEILEQGAIGTAQGIKTGSATMLPAFGGAVGGAKVGAMTGPLAPVATPTLSLLGFVGGFALGDKYSEYLDQFFPLPPRDEFIPYRVGTESFGQALSTIPFAYAMPVMQGNLVSRFLSTIGETARRRPVLFGTSEVGGAGGTGVMGFSAETFFPGDEGTRFLYEVTGGFATPSRWLTSIAADATSAISQRLSSGALTGSERKAADQLLGILKKYEEDPIELSRALMMSLPKSVTGTEITPTAGQKTGSPALMALETSLAKQHELYGDEIKDQGINAFKAYEGLLEKLRNIGDVELLRAAAQQRDQLFRKMLGDRLLFAHRDAADKIAKISRLNPTTDARKYVGTITQNAISASLRDARKVESALWDDAYKSSLKTVGELSPDQLRLFRDNDLEVPDMQSYRDELARASSRLRPGDPPPDILMGRINDVWQQIKTKGGPRTIYEDRRHLQPGFKQIVQKSNGKYVLQEYDLSKKNPFSSTTFPMLVRKSPQELADFLGKIPIKETPVTLQQNLYPRTIEADNFRSQLAKVAASMTPAGFKTNLSPYVKALLEQYGIDENAIDLYRQGMRTPEYLTNKIVPDRFLPAIDSTPIDVGDLILMRGELLDESRRAGSGNSPDRNAARMYGELAHSILTDLSKKENGLTSKEYDTARSFTSSLNDVYTRTFAGEMLEKDARGAMVYTPETLVEAAFTIGTDLTAQRMQQIEDASTFLLQEGRKIAAQSKDPAVRDLLKSLIPDSKARATSVADAANTTIRLAAANSIKQVMRPDGTIENRLDIDSLIRWARENNTLVEKAGLAGDLDNAARAENLYRLVVDQNSKLNNSLKNRATFAKLLGSESPTTVVTQMIRGKNPNAELNKLVRLAKAGGPDAVDGLRATIMDYVHTQATKKGTSAVSPAAYERALFQPLGPNKPSLYALMRSQGIMDVSHGNNIRAILNPLKNIEMAMESGGQHLDEVVSRMGMVGQFGSRFIGAQAGARLSKAVGGQSTIQVPAFGASVAQELFDKMPALSIRLVLEKATKDPAFMAMLLNKSAVTPQQQITLGRQMHAYLLSQGYTDADYNPPEISEVPATTTTGMPAARLMRQLPPAPPTTGVPGLSSAPRVTPQGPGPTAPAAPPAAQMPGQPPQPPNSRQMLQSLFPFDTTLRLGSPLQ